MAWEWHLSSSLSPQPQGADSITRLIVWKLNWIKGYHLGSDTEEITSCCGEGIFPYLGSKVSCANYDITVEETDTRFVLTDHPQLSSETLQVYIIHTVPVDILHLKVPYTEGQKAAETDSETDLRSTELDSIP